MINYDFTNEQILAAAKAGLTDSTLIATKC